MKTRTPEQTDGALKQIDLLKGMISSARANAGYILNTKGKVYPRILGEDTVPSPYNALVMAASSDQQGYDSNVFVGFGRVSTLKAKLRNGYQTPTLYNFYTWNTFVNRNDRTKKIAKAKYEQLSDAEKKKYAKQRTKDIRKLYNVQQTTIMRANPDIAKEIQDSEEGRQRMGNSKGEKEIRRIVNTMTKGWNENLAHVGRSTTGIAYYDNSRDSIMLPNPGSYEHYCDYVQDVMRAGATATASLEHLARSGMAATHGKTDARTRSEIMVAELASAVRMLELGLPARLTDKTMEFAESWCEDMRMDLDRLDAFEADLNKSVEMMRTAEKGQKVEQKTDVNRQQEELLWRSQLPQLSNEDVLAMKSVILHGGMDTGLSSYVDMDHKKELLAKLGCTELYTKVLLTAELFAANNDPAQKEILYSNKVEAGSALATRFQEILTSPQALQNQSLSISDAIRKEVSAPTLKFAMVQDPKSGIVDVILPRAARSGGEVVFANGERMQYFDSPRDVIPETGPLQTGYRFYPYQVKGLSKNLIAASLLRDYGAQKIRFFEKADGVGKYDPSDDYFVGKKVTIATLANKSIKEKVTMDVTKAAENARHPQFTTIVMMPSEQNVLNLLYMEADNASPVAVVVNREDQNIYWTARQNMRSNDPSSRQRGAEAMKALTRKVYAEAIDNPSIRYNKLLEPDPTVPMNRVHRTNIYRDKDKYYISAIIRDGDRSISLEKEITKNQFSRVMQAHLSLPKARNAMASYILGPEIKSALALGENIRQTNIPKETLAQAEQYRDAQHPMIPIIRAGEICYVISNEHSLKTAEYEAESEPLDFSGSITKGFAIPFKEISKVIETLQQQAPLAFLSAPASTVKHEPSQAPMLAANPATKEHNEVLVQENSEEEELDESRPRGIHW